MSCGMKTRVVAWLVFIRFPWVRLFSDIKGVPNARAAASHRVLNGTLIYSNVIAGKKHQSRTVYRNMYPSACVSLRFSEGDYSTNWLIWRDAINWDCRERTLRSCSAELLAVPFGSRTQTGWKVAFFFNFARPAISKKLSPFPSSFFLLFMFYFCLPPKLLVWEYL